MSSRVGAACDNAPVATRNAPRPHGSTVRCSPARSRWSPARIAAWVSPSRRGWRGPAQRSCSTAATGKSWTRRRSRLEAQGLAADKAVFDVTDRAAARAAVAAIEHTHGQLDILFNNAGIQRRHAFADFPQDDWDALIATNLTAPFIVSQAALAGMIRRKRGKIVHIASLLSELARPSVVPYAAAKGGVRQLTRGMAVELAPHNIQVNAIAPGYFATEMNRALIDNAEFNAWVCKRTPAGRWGQPEELAGLAVFLASSASDYVTGQMIVIDGGMSVAL